MKWTLIVGLAMTLAPCAWGQAKSDYNEPPIDEKDRQHWAFQPIRRPAVPNLARHPVDALILAKLQAAQLKPLPEAGKVDLIRRLSYDLTGLPPTPADVETFLKDTSADAYDKLVDRLLASPHYGERWAQHWLDIVRYAESNGYELDADRPHAWRYRDYVVRSFNADKPYDQFLKEQIAGDELAAGKDPKTVPDLFIATGFHRCGPVHVVSGNLDAAVVRQEVLTEMVIGVGQVAMGLTISCARCHDHKFDPISAGDYYRLEAFFAGTRFRDVDLATEAEEKAFVAKRDEVKKKLEPIKKQIEAIDAPIRAKLKAEKMATLSEKAREAIATPTVKRSAEQKKLVKDSEGVLTVRWDEILERLTAEQKAQRLKLRGQLYEIERELPAPAAQAWAVGNDDESPATYVLKRGDVRKRTIKVDPQPLRVISTTSAGFRSRSDLADWLTRRDHPLTARVIVNRLWHYHFGRGIVATPNDFGTRGSRPTHPELLDWLAAELMEPSDGSTPWSLKRIHKLIVTSAAFRRESRPNGPPGDPQNLLLSQMNRVRLDAEALRDGILTAAGTLNRALGGPSVRTPLEPEVYDLIFTEGEPDNLWMVTADVRQHTRRSLYLYAKRNVRYPMLEAFDQPDAINSCAARSTSTFAPQALIMMNGPFTREQSYQLADTLVRQHGANGNELLDDLYRRTVSRTPTREERTLATAFLKEQETALQQRQKSGEPLGIPATFSEQHRDSLPRLRATADLVLALFNSSEFAFRP